MLLKVRADLGELSRIREFVTDSATALGVTPDAFDDLRLAVDEAVTNIITHGYGGPGDVEVELAINAPDLVVTIRDYAPSFDPARAPSVDLRLPGERNQPGGYGLFLIQSVMDDVAHKTVDSGNELTMTKREVVPNEIR